jgi:hypothetical protein
VCVCVCVCVPQLAAGRAEKFAVTQSECAWAVHIFSLPSARLVRYYACKRPHHLMYHSSRRTGGSSDLNDQTENNMQVKRVDREIQASLYRISAAGSTYSPAFLFTDRRTSQLSYFRPRSTVHLIESWALPPRLKKN